MKERFIRLSKINRRVVCSYLSGTNELLNIGSIGNYSHRFTKGTEQALLTIFVEKEQSKQTPKIVISWSNKNLDTFAESLLSRIKSISATATKERKTPKQKLRIYNPPRRTSGTSTNDFGDPINTHNDFGDY